MSLRGRKRGGKVQPSPEQIKRELNKEKKELETELAELQSEWDRIKALNLKHIDEIMEEEVEGIRDEILELTEKLKEIDNISVSDSL